MNTHDYYMISRYVDGEMTAEEIQAFEQMMRGDEDLKNEVELYKEVNASLKTRLHPGEGEEQLLDTMEKLRGEYFRSSAKVVPLKRKRWLAIAAAAAIIIIVMVWSPWSQTDLYRQFASLEMTGFTERGENTDSLLKIITEKFNNKKFEEAIPLFESLLAADSARADLRFYYAAALLETSAVERSRQEFTRVYNGTSVFRYNAAFFIALSYIKEKNKDAAIEWLNRIPEGAAIYSKSSELLKKLR